MVWLLAAAAAMGGPVPVVRGVAYPDIMPVSQVRAGMRGYGLTVFRGVTIERFDVTVVAVVRNGSLVAPGHDMILVRMSGGPMTQRGANLIRGMSGSPVYIGGKCIGAFSQGEPTTKEPLGGVTPIEDMLEAWDPKLPDKPDVAARGPAGSRGRVVELARPIRAGGRRIGRIVFDAPVSREPASAGTLRLRPCTSMVTISGGSRTARKRLAALLEPYGVEVMQAPSGASGKPIRGASLAPGAAFSAMLLLGDVESGATGTVTYRKGDRLLGFGHPFMGIGPLSAPICTATIHDVYPLNAGSYKISTPGPSLGATLQDRAFGISAVIGKSPELIPITVDVDDKTSGRSRVYRMRAVSHPNLYSGLVGLAVGSAVADMHGTPGPVMARVETVIESVTMGRIERRNYVYDARAIDMAVTSDLESILNVLASNPFEPQGIRSAMVRAVIEPGRRTATLDRVSVGAARYEPGDTVDVGVVLRPYRSAPVTMTIPVAIPEDAPNGPLTLTVRGGGAPPAMSIGGLTFRPSSPAAPDQSPPVNVRQMLDRVLEREMGDEIGARLALPTTSVSIEGRALRGLPPTLDAALRSPRVSSVRTDRDEVRATLKTEWVVTGQQMLTINVQREPSVPPGPRSAAPATGLSPGSSPGTPSRPPQGAAMSQTQGRTASQRTTATSQGKAEQPAKPDTTKPNQAVQAPPASATPSATEKPVARVPKVWRQTAREDWVKATLDGVGLSSSGEMALAPSVRRLCSLPGAIVWSLVSDGGSGVYAGLGPEALVCHVGPDGKVETVAALPEVSVHALWRSPDGALYAGTAPQGRTYRIRQGAKPEVVHDAAEPYVLALTGTVDGSVLIGAGGSGGAVYSLSPSGAASALASGLDRHVMSLAVGPDGSVYAGTSGRGTVVRLRAGTTPHVLLDAPGQSFSSLAVMKGGDIVAGAGPRGALYRVAPDGSWRNIRLSEQAPGVASLVATPSGELLVAGGAAISRIGPTDARLQFDVPATAEILCMALGGDGVVWAGTANAGELLIGDTATVAPASRRQPEIESSVHDAGGIARWGRLRWSGTQPPGTRIAVQTRSGECARPDATWSGWGPLRETTDGGDITSPHARYLQYRVTLEGSDAGVSPTIGSVAVSYLPRNQAPVVSFQAPSGGERWSGKQTLKWQASDSDGDTLSFDVTYSSDGGATWAPVPGTPPASATPEPAKAAAPEAAGLRAQPQGSARRPLTVEQVTSELDQHPNLPAAMREAILERTRKLNAEHAASPSQPEPRAPSERPAGPTRESSQSFDTAKLADGTYRFRIAATDRPSNWEGAETATATSEPVVICNAAPVVYVLRSEPALRADKSVRFEAVAVQTAVALTAGQWRVDGGDWLAAAPVDGLADSGLELFRVETGPLAKGKHVIELKVFNAAGLSSVEKVEVEAP